MTTARDLMITAIDATPDSPGEQGELSLALAGAELIDLLAVEAITLDGDRIVPGHVPMTADRLLDQAAASLLRETPFESVDDWLWRRGRDLASRYLAAFDEDGQLTRQRHRMFRADRTVLVDSPERRLASDRNASNEPVLAALATTAGIRGNETESPGPGPDTAVGTILATVGDAATELKAVRQQRGIEQAAFDNIWRGY